MLNSSQSSISNFPPTLLQLGHGQLGSYHLHWSYPFWTANGHNNQPTSFILRTSRDLRLGASAWAAEISWSEGFHFPKLGSRITNSQEEEEEELRLALVGEAAVCKRGCNVDQILFDLRERFGETMKSATRKYAVLQWDQLTLRQLGDEVKQLFNFSNGTVGPREAEYQMIIKFPSALKNPEIHRSCSVSLPHWSKLCCMLRHTVHLKKPEARKA